MMNNLSLTVREPFEQYFRFNVFSDGMVQVSEAEYLEGCPENFPYEEAKKIYRYVKFTPHSVR